MMFKVKERGERRSAKKKRSRKSLERQPQHDDSSLGSSTRSPSRSASRSCLKYLPDDDGSTGREGAGDSNTQHSWPSRSGRGPLSSEADESLRNDKVRGRPTTGSVLTAGSSHGAMPAAPYDPVMQNRGSVPTQRNSERKVRFGYVQVREYERIISDNPSCSCGAPVGIGWAYGNERKVIFKVFEKERRLFRRSRRQFALSKEQRMILLMEWGYKLPTIASGVRKVLKAKHRRRRTVNSIGTYDRWEEVVENASRKIKRSLSIDKSSKQMAQLEKAYNSSRNACPSSLYNMLREQKNSTCSGQSTNEASEQRSPVTPRNLGIAMNRKVCRRSSAEESSQNTFGSFQRSEDECSSSVSGSHRGPPDSGPIENCAMEDHTALQGSVAKEAIALVVSDMDDDSVGSYLTEDSHPKLEDSTIHGSEMLDLDSLDDDDSSVELSFDGSRMIAAMPACDITVSEGVIETEVIVDANAKDRAPSRPRRCYSPKRSPKPKVFHKPGHLVGVTELPRLMGVVTAG